MPIYKAENGSYYVKWRDASHKQHTKRGFDRKREAEEFLAALKTDLARGDYVSPSAGKATVNAIAELWLPTRSNLKPSTLRTELSAWEKHVQPVWGPRPVGSIERSEVSAWVASLTASGSSASVTLRAHGILSAILDFAVDDKRLNKNPAKGLKNLPKKISKPRAYLSHAEVKALAEASGEHSLIIFLLAYSGLRWGELAALKVEHLDILRGRIAVTENAVDTGGVVEVGTPKGHERRSVPMPLFLKEALAEACRGKAPGDLVFPASGGGYMRRPNTNRPKKSWFITAKRLSGVPERLTIHDLRHTAASLNVSSGADVKAVQRMLGHKSAAMTLDTYADLFDSDLDALSERLEAARVSQNVLNMFSLDEERAKRKG